MTAVIETDRYGRFVATCSAGETDINREMVRLGWALAWGAGTQVVIVPNLLRCL